MIDLNYFNIGFRAENSAKELRKFRDNNSYNESLMKDAYELLTLCKRAWKGDFGETNDESEKISACREVLFEDINTLAKRPDIENIEKFYGREIIIDKTKSMIEEILDNQKSSEEQLELGRIFLNSLAEKCAKFASPAPSCW